MKLKARIMGGLLTILAVSITVYVYSTSHTPKSYANNLSPKIIKDTLYKSIQSIYVNDKQKDSETVIPSVNDNHSENTNTLKEKPTNTVERKKLDILQSLQETNYYCGPACLQMALRYHSIEMSQDELAKMLHTVPSTGTEYADMVRVMNDILFDIKRTPSENEMGYHVQTLHVNDNVQTTAQVFAKRCEQNINDGYPIFAAIDLQALYPDLPRANHVVLVNGYVKENGKIIAYYLVDPYPPVQDEVYAGLKIFTEEELIHALLVNEEPAYVW